jgi:hypothetical protein
MALEARLKSAGELSTSGKIEEAARDLSAIVLDSGSNDAEAVRVKEQAIGELCALLVKKGDAQGLADLLTSLRAFFNSIPKAKTAKLVRNIIDSIAKVPNSTALQVRGRMRRRSRPEVRLGMRQLLVAGGQRLGQEQSASRCSTEHIGLGCSAWPW